MGKRKHAKPKRTSTKQWVGGRLSPPIFFTQGAPRRVEFYVWIEVPDRFVVGISDLQSELSSVSFSGSLLNAMRTPMVGPPRIPSRIRVADEQLAAEVREAVPMVDVVVGPTPELDDLAQRMIETLPMMPDGEELDTSYFENGRITEDAVAQLFVDAGHLFTIAPWNIASDTEVVRVDIPKLGVEGACISIIGALGESLGLLIFPSNTAFERYLAAAHAGLNVNDPELDLGTSTLALNFESATDLPPQMRREAAQHGWPVAHVSGYPRVQHRERDGTPRPLTPRDVAIVTAIAGALGAFIVKHQALFGKSSYRPVCESYVNEDHLEVRFTIPYHAAELFGVPDTSFDNSVEQPSPRRAQKKVGRNQPCPCGSGRKYKKCCLSDKRAKQTLESVAVNTHDMDRHLIQKMIHFASEIFPGELPHAAKPFADPSESLELLVPWSVYQFAVDGRPIVDWYLESHGQQLSMAERNWLNAQRQGWLSLWEIANVVPGTSLTLRDLLTGEQRTILEKTASTLVVHRDVILARIVDYKQMTLLCGVHPRPLSPTNAAAVVGKLRKYLRRKTAVAVDRLRPAKVSTYMIKRWEKEVEASALSRKQPPKLHNTDGDELLFTVDHYTFKANARKPLERALKSLAARGFSRRAASLANFDDVGFREDGVTASGPNSTECIYTFHQDGNAMNDNWENTVMGRAILESQALHLESNSIARADTLRARIEAACGDLITYKLREYTDPLGPGLPGPAGNHNPPSVPSQTVREFKGKHYESWIDEPVPALGGKTPRQAARTKTGRNQLDVLLKEMENQEARLPPEQRYEFSQLRQKLLDVR